MLLTSREAASFLRIGRTKLGELTRSGEVPAYRLGDGRTSPLRYKRAELIRWLEHNRLDPSGTGAAGPRTLPRGR
jgi:excisionase family DNA binding protein